MADADLVITGEGRFDETSLTGKTCGTVIAAAAKAGVPVAVAAGQASDMPTGPGGVPPLACLVTLAGLAGGAAAAMAGPRRWLRRAGVRLAGDLGGKFSGLAGESSGMGTPADSDGAGDGSRGGRR
jgi:glycerate kinase